MFVILEPPLIVTLSPSPVILSGAKDLVFLLRVNSAKGLGFRLRINSVKNLMESIR